MKVLQQMVHHPLTDKGIITFRQDWEKARASAAQATPAKSTAG
jgi:transaldolase